MRHPMRPVVLVLAVGALLCPACSDNGSGPVVETIVGSGVVIEEGRQVAGVTRVTKTTIGDLDVQLGAVEDLSVTAETNLMPHLVTRMSGGTLIIETPGNVDLEPTRAIQFRLTATSLERLTHAGVGPTEIRNLTGDSFFLISSGVGDVDLPGIDLQSLGVTISGVGDVNASGVVDEQDILLSGVGDYEAPELQSRETVVTLSGVGSVTVRVSERLVVTITGEGSVFYYGDPVVESSISGSGRVEKIGD